MPSERRRGGGTLSSFSLSSEPVSVWYGGRLFSSRSFESGNLLREDYWHSGRLTLALTTVSVLQLTKSDDSYQTSLILFGLRASTWSVPEKKKVTEIPEIVFLTWVDLNTTSTGDLSTDCLQTELVVSDREPWAYQCDIPGWEGLAQDN